MIKNKNRGGFIDRKERKKNKTTSVYRLVIALRIQPKYNSSIIISPFGAIGTGILLASWGEAEAARIIGSRLCSGGFPDIAGSTCLSKILMKKKITKSKLIIENYLKKDRLVLNIWPFAFGEMKSVYIPSHTIANAAGRLYKWTEILALKWGILLDLSTKNNSQISHLHCPVPYLCISQFQFS